MRRATPVLATAALFVLGLGITMLQVAANPLVAALGPPERSHFRLTFAQAFNSLGVVLGVNFGARMMLGSLPATIGSGPAIDSSHRAAALSSVANAFLMIAVMLAVLMAFIWLFRDRITSETANADVGLSGSIGAALRCRWAIAGAIAIGLYVGAEVSIGSIMINFLSQPVILDIPLESAGFYLANIYWMGALVGRFIGSYLLTRIPAPRLLMIAAAAAVLLCLTVVAATGPVAGWAALAVGLCNAIMFPTIFTITLERAKVSQPATSGLLCLAIVGGAIVPYTVGRLADLASLSLAFALPLCSYIYITSFAIGAQAGKQHTRW